MTPTPGGLVNLIMPHLPVKIKEDFQMEPILEEIKRYIEETEMDEKANTGYQIGINDLLALCDVAERDICGAVCYTFLFGKAMGWRAAKEMQPPRP